MKPKEFEVIYKFTVAPTVPFPSALNWNTEPIGELIRCKDCKYWGVIDGINWMTCRRLIITSPQNVGYDFCSYAERKEE